jgi:hypothetical protein
VIKLNQEIHIHSILSADDQVILATKESNLQKAYTILISINMRAMKLKNSGKTT